MIVLYKWVRRYGACSLSYWREVVTLCIGKGVKECGDGFGCGLGECSCIQEGHGSC